MTSADGTTFIIAYQYANDENLDELTDAAARELTNKVTQAPPVEQNVRQQPLGNLGSDVDREFLQGFTDRSRPDDENAGEFGKSARGRAIDGSFTRRGRGLRRRLACRRPEPGGLAGLQAGLELELRIIEATSQWRRRR